MNKDLLKISFLYLIRRKNNKWFRLILFVCSFLLIFSMVISYNVLLLIKNCISNQAGFRTIGVSTQETDEQKNIKELSNIDHVVDVYISGEKEVYVTINGTQKNVTLVRSNKKNIPNVVYGRTINEDEKNVAVCPINFYPSEQPYDVDLKKTKTNDELLNTSFEISYSSLNVNEKQKLYTKEYTIVGLYDPSTTFGDLITCYVNSSEVEEIINNIFVHNNQNNENIIVYNTYSVVVDSRNNIESVKNKLESMSYTYNGMDSTLDIKTINIIKLIVIAAVFVVLITIIVLSYLYTKKIILKFNNEISVKKYLGYSKQLIIKIYMLEILLNNIIIYFISSILSYFIIMISIKTIPFISYINILINKITITPVMFIELFMFIVVLPSIISLFLINKSYKKI